MATDQDRERAAARKDAELALLKAIPDALKMGHAEDARHIAEAFASIVSPARPHGGVKVATSK